MRNGLPGAPLQPARVGTRTGHGTGVVVIAFVLICVGSASLVGVGSSESTRAPPPQGSAYSFQGACGLLPAMYPLLTTAANNTTFPTPFVIPPYILHPNGSSNPSANGTAPPFPPELNFSWWNVTVGEVRNYWLSVCQTPAFLAMAQAQPVRNFSTGWEGNSKNHTAAISVGFYWVGPCVTNFSSFQGPGNQSRQSPPLGYQGPCSFQTYWTGEFLPNGTTNASGPYQYEGWAGISFPNSSSGSRGPSGGTLLGLGRGSWIILGAVIAAVVTAILVVGAARRRYSTTRPGPAEVPMFVLPESTVAFSEATSESSRTESPLPRGPSRIGTSDEVGSDAPGRQLLDDLL